MDLKFDIKEKVDELVKKLQEDPALLKNFQSDPVKTLEQLTGIDLPEQQLQPVITGIKAMLGAGDTGPLSYCRLPPPLPDRRDGARPPRIKQKF